MSDVIIRTECPKCLPDSVQVDIRYVEWKHCNFHKQSDAGSDDAAVSLVNNEFLAFSGTAESSLETNRAWSMWMRKNRERKERSRRRGRK